jgi:glycosyltransferase involved in cell wall biosynthesis
MNPKPSRVPRVSVIIRTRHRPDLLDRAVRDVLAQDFEDFEAIVVDDGDDSAPAAVVLAVHEDESAGRVVLVSRANQEHGRWVAANAGLEAARGEYVVLHDDDDLWDSGFLAVTVGHLDAHPETAAACTRTQIIIERPDDEGELVRTDEYPFLPQLSCISVMDMMRANRIPPISLLYRRSLHEEFGAYDQSLSVLGDWEFYLRVLSRYTIDLIEGPPLAFWSHRPQAEGDGENSISAQMIRFATDDQIRDRYIREGVLRDGLPAYMHLAHEVHWLDRRIESRFKALATGEGSSEGHLQRIEQRIAALHEEVRSLRAHIDERTSFSRILRRPLRRRVR